MNGDSATLWWDPPASVNEILVRGYTVSYGIGTPSQKVIIEGANTNAFTINGLSSLFFLMNRTLFEFFEKLCLFQIIMNS